MACAERTGALLRRADGELPAGSQRLLDRHLAACEECRATLELMTRENRAIATALAPAPRRSGRPVLGRILAAAAVLLFTGGAVAGLLLSAESVESARDRSAARAEVHLDAPVLIRAEDLPLKEFLAEVSEVSGVTVHVSGAALTRFPTRPRVSITLCQPITLRSLLALLSEFHGLIPEVNGDGVILH
jgi:hypothetical protein